MQELQTEAEECLGQSKWQWRPKSFCCWLAMYQLLLLRVLAGREYWRGFCAHVQTHLLPSSLVSSLTAAAFQVPTHGYSLNSGLSIMLSGCTPSTTNLRVSLLKVSWDMETLPGCLVVTNFAIGLACSIANPPGWCSSDHALFLPAPEGVFPFHWISRCSLW